MDPLKGGEPNYNVMAGKEGAMAHSPVPWARGTWRVWVVLTLALDPLELIKNN